MLQNRALLLVMDVCFGEGCPVCGYGLQHHCMQHHLRLTCKFADHGIPHTALSDHVCPCIFVSVWPCPKQATHQ